MKMRGNYRLDENGKPVLCEDLLEWAAWMETADRTVRKDTVRGLLISTIFLGVDHRRGPDVGLPVLWETLIFAADGEVEYGRRWTSRESALDGHMEMLQVLQGWDQDVTELERIAALDGYAKVEKGP